MLKISAVTLGVAGKLGSTTARWRLIISKARQTLRCANTHLLKISAVTLGMAGELGSATASMPPCCSKSACDSSV